MTSWRIKPLGEFRKLWHDAMAYPPGEWTLLQTLSEATARRAADDWRYFQWCLRQHPSHRLHELLASHSRRTRIRRDWESGQWRLQLIVRESASTLLSEAQILAKPIDKP